MSNRRPADPHYTGRPTGALARSPAERLEPTRPAARAAAAALSPRARRIPRPWSACSAASSRSCLLLMALAGGAALAAAEPGERAGAARAQQGGCHPQGREHPRDRRAARARRRHLRSAAVHCRLPAVEDHRLGDSARPVQLKAGDYQIPQAASMRQVIDIIAEGKTITYRVTIPEGLTSHQIVERLKADPNLTGEIAEVPAGRLAAAGDLHRPARRHAPSRSSTRCGGIAQADRQGLGAAQEGPAAQDLGGGASCWRPSSRRRPAATTSASAWPRCSSIG